MATEIGSTLFVDISGSEAKRGVVARRQLKSLVLANPRGAPRLTEAELDAMLDSARFAGCAAGVGKRVTGSETREQWGPA